MGDIDVSVMGDRLSALSVLVSRATATGDWLVEEAADLEQGLLSSSKRLAQVRLELQCSVDLAKALSKAEKRVEALDDKAAAELKKRILPPAQDTPEVPTVSRMEILTCEPGASQSLVLWKEERVFEVLARVVARRDTGAPTAGGGPATAFVASTVAAQFSRLSAEAFMAATQALRACRQELLEECRGSGLELLDEAMLGFAGAAVRCNTAESNAAAWLAPGWLELLQAAAEAGVVRLVAINGVWDVARVERVSEWLVASSVRRLLEVYG